MGSKILVTGGTGYIGSHTCVELLNSGYEIVILDDLLNSDEIVLDKIKELTNKDFKFYKVNILDKEALRKIFNENKDIDSVINFAGFKAVGESVEKPLKYYTNNISGSLVLLEVMMEFNVKKFIFSSSATVYGNPEIIPITEECKIGGVTNPYGRTKYMIEEILQDLYKSDNTWSIVILRYFNPIGAHKSGIIGEVPNGIPNNLMPYITRVANKQLKELSVFGDDYNTKDGTGVRDYIHVVDLATGHLKALEKINKESNPKLHIYNLGTGNGYSVLEMITTFEKVNNVKVKYKIVKRRDGDIATCYSNPKKAMEELNWEAKYSLEDMCRDSWNFQKQN
jgi:UDP-glucose 4-epimerase